MKVANALAVLLAALTLSGCAPTHPTKPDPATGELIKLPIPKVADDFPSILPALRYDVAYPHIAPSVSYYLDPKTEAHRYHLRSQSWNVWYVEIGRMLDAVMQETDIRTAFDKVEKVDSPDGVEGLLLAFSVEDYSFGGAQARLKMTVSAELDGRKILSDTYQVRGARVGFSRRSRLGSGEFFTALSLGIVLGAASGGVFVPVYYDKGPSDFEKKRRIQVSTKAALDRVLLAVTEDLRRVPPSEGLVKSGEADTEPGTAKVVFLRPSRVGSNTGAGLFDITSGEPLPIGRLLSEKKLAYDVPAGKRRFMAVGKRADFLDAELAADRTYHVLVLPQAGFFQSAFELKPVHSGKRQTAEYANWIGSTNWVDMARTPSTGDIDTAKERQAKYLPKWLEMRGRDILRRRDGQ